MGLVTIIKLIFAGNEEPGTIAVYSLPLLGTEMKPEFQTLYTDNIPRDNRSCSQMYIDRDAFAIGPETLMWVDPPPPPPPRKKKKKKEKKREQK